MASKTVVRTYRILKSDVWTALNNNLAPIPTRLLVKSFDSSLGITLTGTLTDIPSQYIDTVDILVSKAEIANFVNSHCGTALSANNILNAKDGIDSSFYEVDTI